MNYKVLYRKYRPNNFNELVGQNHIVKILRNSIINDKIAHAYLFTGPRGTGKTSTAKIFAKALNCMNPNDGVSCDQCDNCINFKSSPDIIELDAASNNGVDSIREIIDNVGIAPTGGKYKIYIIDEVHMLSTSAWNAFLKTLEEPPSNVIFILATTDVQKVPITVLSRCQRFDFTRIDRNLIYDNLSNICTLENISFTEEALKEISFLSDGCMRDALSILDQLSKVSDSIDINTVKNNYGTVTEDDLNTLYNSILNNDIDVLTDMIDSIKESGIDIKIFITKLLDNLVIKAVNMKKRNVGTNVFKLTKKIITSLNDLLYKLNNSSNGYLLLEMELISFINDESNQISQREISQIISREIISDNSVEKKRKEMLSKLDNVKSEKSVYNICDEFINIRVNNAFATASKENKNLMLKNWNKFLTIIMNDKMSGLMTLGRGSEVKVASDNNMIISCNSESASIIGNNKLYEIENKFNSLFKCNYKLIFVSEKKWNNILKEFMDNKDSKIYNYIDDSEYINDEDNTVAVASDVFGEDKINIE